MTLEERAFRKATRRLIPFLFLIYTDFEVGLLAAIPFAFATAAMILASRRRGGIAPFMVTGAVGTLITAYSHSPLLLTLGITLAAVGLLAALPRFWIGPTALLSGTAAAAGIALVAVLGNVGGFVGPAFTGDREGLERRLRAAAHRAGDHPRRVRTRHRACVSATTSSASATSPAMITTTMFVTSAAGSQRGAS